MMPAPRSAGITYRLAWADDAPAVGLLVGQAIAGRRGVPSEPEAQAAEQRAVAEALASPITIARLAYCGAELVACLVATDGALDDPESVHPTHRHLDYLMVSPSYWGQGLATGLLSWLDAVAHALHLTDVNLWTEIDNERARALYERCGFAVSGRQRVHPHSAEEQLEYIRTYPSRMLAGSYLDRPERP